MKILSAPPKLEKKIKCKKCKTKLLIEMKDWKFVPRWTDRMEDSHPESFNAACPICHESYEINEKSDKELFLYLKYMDKKQDY